jgi:hypothetical protein
MQNGGGLQRKMGGLEMSVVSGMAQVTVVPIISRLGVYLMVQFRLELLPARLL